MGETFKDYVIDIYAIEEMDPLPEEPGYRSDDDDVQMEEQDSPMVNPKDDGYKNMILARIFDPDDIKIIDGFSQAMAHETSGVKERRKYLSTQFPRIFSRKLGVLLFQPLFEFLGFSCDNLLIVMAINSICKKYPKLKELIPAEAMAIYKAEYAKHKAVQQTLKEEKAVQQRPVKRRKLRPMRRMDPVLEDLDECVPPQGSAWLIEYKHASTDEESGPPQKKARVDVDLTCTETMV